MPFAASAGETAVPAPLFLSLGKREPARSYASRSPRLPSTSRSRARSENDVSFAAKRLLVTGFPGFHARKLALHLLAVEPEAKLVLLRRASDSERSAEHLARLQPAERERVRELTGDPAALDFGLSGAEYLELAASVQRVYHFASVLQAKRRSEAAAYNIACAREALEFASAARGLRGLILLSSVTVCGTRTGLIRGRRVEPWPDLPSALGRVLWRRSSRSARGAAICHKSCSAPRRSWVIPRAARSIARAFPIRGWRSSTADRASWSCPSRIDPRLRCKSCRSISWCARRTSSAPSRRPYGKRYHLVDPEPPTLKEFLQFAAQACGKHLAENFNPGAFTRGLAAKPGLRLLTQGGAWLDRSIRG